MDDQSFELRHRLSLSIDCEITGVSIEKLTFVSASTSLTGTRIDVSTPDGTLYLENINQLAGYVFIDNEAKALRYVRFFTSPLLFYSINPIEIEILQDSEIDELLIFSSDERVRQSWKAASILTDHSGSEDADPALVKYVWGGLSPAAYAQGRFHGPNVTRADGRFLITRWIYCQRDRDPIEECVVALIEESVSHIGEYSRRTISEMKAPDLPGVEWFTNRYSC
jgi:hypothetical protein